MKKLLILLIVVFIPWSLFSLESLDSSQMISNLIDELSSIVENSDNDLLKKNLRLPLHYINEEILSFRFVDRIEDYDESVLGNAMFSYTKENNNLTQFITIENKLFRYYEENKSIIMAIIMHELGHAYAYFDDTEYFISIRENKLERYLYEMDAIYLEAQFIEECKKRKYNFTLFENFVLSSYYEDNLSMVSLLLLHIDNKLVWQLISIKDRYKNREITIEELMTEVSEIGHDLSDIWLNDIKKSGNKWNRYVILVQLRSYHDFLASIINEIITDEVLITMEAEILEINDLRELIYEEYNPLWDTVLVYSDNEFKYLIETE